MSPTERRIVFWVKCAASATLSFRLVTGTWTPPVDAIIAHAFDLFVVVLCLAIITTEPT